MDDEIKLEIKRSEMYSEFKRFWDFWYEKPDLTMRECFTIYLMQSAKE